jgi:hypothetical protein
MNNRFAFGRKLSVFACALALLAVAPRANGQATDANLVGIVTDPTGAAVPNANVEIENLATGVKISTATSTEGAYRFNNVPVGRYTLIATGTGFAQTTIHGVQIELNKTASFNVRIEVGSVSTSIVVTEAGAVIDTTSAQLQSNYDTRQIVNMPIIENSNSLFGALQLALMSAGVASNGGVGQGTGPSVGGQRPMNNNFMIEGVDNNNKTVTGPLVYVPTEATAEFSLLQNQFGAEFGHSSGGQFNTVIRSGTNQMHGSVYEYFQNRNLNAVDQAFARQDIRENPRYDQNRLGASVGGPIKKDKLFYFGNFEYAPLGQALTTGTPVLSPTAAGYALLDKMTGLSKNNYSILKQYVPAAPTASDSTTVDGVKIPIGILPVPGASFTNQYTAIASVDYNPTSNDQFRGRFVYNKNSSLDTAANLPTFWTAVPQKFYLASLANYHTFSPTLTNELRLAYNRFSQFYTVPGGLSFPGLDVFPNITIDNDLGIQIGPDGNAPQYAVQNTYQLVENLSWNKGKHMLKFGFDGRNVISPQHFIQRERGDYNWPDLESYLHDLVPDDLAERNLGSTSYYGNQWATYLYGNDSWRVRRNVTVNLGIRWERTTVPLGMGLQSLNHISDVPGLITFGSPKTSNKNFAPRIGIAYSPGSSGKTSIRAGFGMAYDVIFDNVGSTAYPPQLSSTYDAGNFPNIFKAPFLANGGIAPGSLAGGGNLNQVDARQSTSSFLPDQVLPYSIQWNIGAQHVFHNDYTFEARYLGTRGVHLLVQDRLNMISKVTPDRYLPTYLTAPTQAQLDSLTWTLTKIQAFSNLEPRYAAAGFDGAAVVGFMPWGNSTYNGLALQMTRRFAKGFQLVGAYTWSHNIDDSTATHFSTLLTPRRPEDFQNFRAERSSSALDRRQRLTASWVWETPWMAHSDKWFAKNVVGNWRFVGSYTAETGELATVQSGTDTNINGDSAGDRTVINPAGDANRGSGVTTLKNSAGATVAYLALDPSARYINAAAGALANGGRNTLQMPGINNFDLSLGKRFNLAETRSVEFRADLGNALNHPQYTAGYVNSIRATSQTTNRNFLLPSNSQFANWSGNFPSSARSMQLALRFVF